MGGGSPPAVNTENRPIFSASTADSNGNTHGNTYLSRAFQTFRPATPTIGLAEFNGTTPLEDLRCFTPSDQMSTDEESETPSTEEDPEDETPRPPSGVFSPTAPRRKPAQEGSLNPFPLRKKLPPLVVKPQTDSERSTLRLDRNPLQVPTAHPNCVVPTAVGECQRQRWEQANMQTVQQFLVHFVRAQRQHRIDKTTGANKPRVPLARRYLKKSQVAEMENEQAVGTQDARSPSPSSPKTSNFTEPHAPNRRPDKTTNNKSQQASTGLVPVPPAGQSQSVRRRSLGRQSVQRSKKDGGGLGLELPPPTTSGNTKSQPTTKKTPSHLLLPSQMVRALPHQYGDTLQSVGEALLHPSVRKKSSASEQCRPSADEDSGKKVYPQVPTMSMSTFIHLKQERQEQRKQRRAQRKAGQACKYLSSAANDGKKLAILPPKRPGPGGVSRPPRA
eukprot:TRINITY_DN56696_c1_g1_i1.p1 TRINITY_DN56696_c1_g1~~TRINITY_DN56696_c1_g1_i1.p1  ORF type:complete len:453 (+),score=22.62 TRINITY_DN56696_c1_g1_i1:23-1360(+)